MGSDHHSSIAIWRGASVASLAAAIALGVFAFTQNRNQGQNGRDLFDRGEIAPLTSAPLESRAAFLELGLASSGGAEKLRANRHAFAVALSNVRSSDAQVLFRKALWPSLKTSSDPQVLAEASALLDAWDIPEALGQSDRDALASNLVDRIILEDSPDVMDALAFALRRSAGFTSNATAEKLARRLLQAIAQNRVGQSQFALVSSFASLPRVSAASLLELLLREKNPYRLQMLARSATDLARNLDAAKTAQIAKMLSARLSSDQNTLAVEALEKLLEPLEPKLEPSQVAEVASALVERAYFEYGDSEAQSLMSGLVVFSKRLDSATVQKLAARLAERIAMEKSAKRQAIYAAGLGSLAKKVSAGSIASTGALLATRIASERDESDMEILLEGLAALKESAGESNIALAATAAVNRMMGETDVNALVDLMQALEKLDGTVRQRESEELADRIVNRIVREPNYTAILPLSMAMDALDEEIRPEKTDELAKKFLARMRATRDPQMLRALAVGMQFLKDKAAPGLFDEAASILSKNLEEARDIDDIKILAFAMHAVAPQASSGPFERAASVIIQKMSSTHDPNDLHDLGQAFQGVQAKAGAPQIDEAAIILVDRLTEQTSIEKMLVLRQNVLAFQDRALSTALLVSKLVTRIEAEHDPALLRSLGETLANLSSVNLTATQIAKIGHAFEIADAPCDVVPHIENNAQARFVGQQLLNPQCSESSWIKLAASLGERTKQRIVRGAIAKPPLPDLDFNGMGSLQDDDDEQDSKPNDPKASQEPAHVDFNLLSHVLGQDRPAELFSPAPASAMILAACLLLISFISGAIAYRNSARASVRS